MSMSLKEWRRERGFTYAAAAEELGLPNATSVRRYERGDVLPSRKRASQMYERSGYKITRWFPEIPRDGDGIAGTGQLNGASAS